MADFREDLYANYVSQFKEENRPLSGKALASYFQWCRHKFLPLFEGIPNDGSILELGCGPGYMLQFLGQCGFQRVKGIDLSKEQVELALQRGCDAEAANLFEYLQGKEEFFDAILALDLVEHFHKEELLALAPLLLSALKKGGRLVLQTPNGEGLFPRQIIYGDLTHLTVLTPGSLRQLFRGAGFDRFRFFETGPVPKNFKGGLRLLLWTGIKTMANAIRKIETGKSQKIWTENMICCCEKPRD